MSLAAQSDVSYGRHWNSKQDLSVRGEWKISKEASIYRVPKLKVAGQGWQKYIWNYYYYEYYYNYLLQALPAAEIFKKK